MTLMIPIGYCGKKDSEVDHLYGTYLVWTPGVVHDVPEEKAKLLLAHEDVWYDTRSKGAKKKDPIVPEQMPSKRLEDEAELPTAAKVHLMPVEDLRRYALTNYNEYIDPALDLPETLAAVVRLMHTRG